MSKRIQTLALLLAIFIVLTVIPPFYALQAADTSNSWTKLANMPTSRYGLGLAVVSGKIYAIGGLNDKGELAVNEMYDPVANKWSTKASMPTARAGFAIAVYESKIYVIGGSVGNSFTGNMEVYDTISDTWEHVASMPTPRADLTANIVDGKIYLFGGKTYSSGTPSHSQTNVTQVYDVKTNTWSTNTSMPMALQGYASTVIGSKIYVIGGAKQSVSGVDSSVSTLQIYNTQTGVWVNGSFLNAPASYGCAVVTLGVMAPSRIYYIGGYSTGAFSDKTLIYNVEEDSWSEGSKMSASRAYFGLAVVNDVIYAIGGFDGTRGLNLCEEFKPYGYGKIPPVITVLSPENMTYKSLHIEYDVSKAVSWAGFSLDNNANKTLKGITEITDIADGQHVITIFANDTLGNMGASQPVHFTIDNAAPTITILIPLEQTYNTADIVLTFIINKPASYLSYSLDDQHEIPITGNITLPALSNGKHSIIINAIDELGNAGSSNKVTFTIATFPIFKVSTAITVTIIILAAIYLIFKRIKTGNRTLKTSLDYN
jgi:N-acetylneuraminic acid mutarotase